MEPHERPEPWLQEHTPARLTSRKSLRRLLSTRSLHHKFAFAKSTDVETETATNGQNDLQTNSENEIRADVLVIGAGFSGITAVDRVRKQGLSVKCLESGDGLGGVWYWNRYPGARVDSEMPFYQLNIPEVWKTWTFSERFPDHEELRRYIAHIDKTLGISKDTYFNARVIEATHDKIENVWVVTTQQGHVARGKYLILATGLLHRTYTPEFPGIERYKGDVHHSGAWPENFEAQGKKIGLVGAGATAVQITQELGKKAHDLTIFLRRPSFCLPMRQRKLSEVEQRNLKMYYPALFQSGRSSYSGFPAAQLQTSILDASKEDRLAHLDHIWLTGGFHFTLSTYRDVFLDGEANELQYKYWRRQVCKRLTDPEKQNIMAPDEKPYYMGTKRNPLEQDYYEVLNQPNVHIHDLVAAPVTEFSEKGIVTADGKEHELDAVVFATGFDSFTGSLTKLGLKDKNGVDLKDLWQDGVSTYLGMTMSGFPNLFMAYSPHAPVALSNGPTIIEAQVEMIVDVIKRLEAEHAKTIEPRMEAEGLWKTALDEISQQTLFPFTNSWWNGSNIPGKKSETMNFIGGIQIYEQVCRAAFEDWKGFKVKFDNPARQYRRKAVEAKQILEHLLSSGAPATASA